MEHVPPKGLFPEPRPSDLITVPSCEKHNKTYSKDDEYFIWLITTASPYSSDAIRVIHEKVIKAFKRRPAYHRRIMSEIVDVDIVTENKLYLRTVKAFRYDERRVRRIVNKIVRGLYYYEQNGVRIFPTDYHVRKFYLNPPLKKSTTEIMQNSPGRLIADGNFWYKYSSAKEDSALMLWFLMFFGNTLILALTDSRSTPKIRL